MPRSRQQLVAGKALLASYDKLARAVQRLPIHDSDLVTEFARFVKMAAGDDDEPELGRNGKERPHVSAVSAMVARDADARRGKVTARFAIRLKAVPEDRESKNRQYNADHNLVRK